MLCVCVCIFCSVDSLKERRRINWKNGKDKVTSMRTEKLND
jgi:uncharacterized Fe-S cluster-containing radical SAM superfamily enzyme